MKISRKLLLEFQKHHEREFKFINFGNNKLMWECYYNGPFERRDGNDSIIDYNPLTRELKMFTDFNLCYSVTAKVVAFYVEFSSYCSVETWEDFEEIFKQFKIWSNATLKFKKDIIIETKKVECDGDFK